MFEYTIDNREVTLQIAADSEFTDIVYTSVHTGSHKVADYALSGLAHYYARALYKRGDDELVTPAIEFYTPVVQPVVPAIAFPVAGGDFHADQHITLEGIAGPSILRVEVSADKSFPARQIYQNAKVGLSDMTDPKSGAEIRISGKSLVDGSTYWCRARATFRAYDEHGDISAVNTEYSAPCHSSTAHPHPVSKTSPLKTHGSKPTEIPSLPPPTSPTPKYPRYPASLWHVQHRPPPALFLSAALNQACIS